MVFNTDGHQLNQLQHSLLSGSVRPFGGTAVYNHFNYYPGYYPGLIPI